MTLGTKWSSVAKVTPRPLYLRETTRVSTRLEAEWAPEPIWTVVEKEKNLFLLLGFEPRIAQPAASR
jgi:hypothetical protein